MHFTYEAMNSDGLVLTDRVEAGSSSEAADALRGKGLTVLRLGPAGGSAAVPAQAALKAGSGRAKPADLVLFTRQLKMLLEAGSSLVPALEAIEQQTNKASFAAIVQRIREDVEQGGTLSEAFQERPNIFKPVFCSMVSAGEATASLPQTFDRLNELSARQQQTRKAIIGALLYPCILSVLVLGVAGVVLGFVVPRFVGLFESLNTPLPAVTQVLFAMSHYAGEYWPIGTGLLVATVAGIVAVMKVDRLRREFDNLLLKMPGIGHVARRLTFARVLRIWAAMLRCHVPLLEAIQHSKTAVTNAAFLALIKDVEETVSAGGSIGRALGQSNLVEPVVASAIHTGEENGRLTESVEFVSGWMDDDNAQVVAGLARVAEPALLAIMGLFVGLVAMSLFIPLFDLAMAGG